MKNYDLIFGPDWETELEDIRSKNPYSSSSYDLQLMRSLVIEMLEKEYGERFIPFCSTLQTSHIKGKKFQLPINCSNGKPPRSIEFLDSTGKVPGWGLGRTYVEERRFISQNGELKDVVEFNMNVEWGKNNIDFCMFIMEKDKPIILNYMIEQKIKSSYEKEAFPKNALTWLEGAKRFFSNDRGGFLKKHNLPQQLGIILSGPPGCGKTMFLRLLEDELLTKNDGTYKIEHFTPSRLAACSANGDELRETGLFVFDDIEELMRERLDGNSTMVLPWLLTQTDAQSASVSRLLVLLTNHIEKLDDALLRPGRFDTTLVFPLPDKYQINAALKFYMGTDYKKEISDEIVERISNLPIYSLSHIAHLARLYYSGFVSSWDDAFEVLKTSDYKGMKTGAKLGRNSLGFGK
jgi:hypothetical protein